MGNYAQQPTNKMVGVAQPEQIQKSQAQPQGLFSNAVGASVTPMQAPSTPATKAFDVNRGDPNKRVGAALIDPAGTAEAQAAAAAKKKAEEDAVNQSAAKSKADAAAKAASEQAAANAAMQAGFWQQYEINKRAKEEAAYAAQNQAPAPGNVPPPVTPQYGETDPYEIWKASGRQGPRPEGY